MQKRMLRVLLAIAGVACLEACFCLTAWGQATITLSTVADNTLSIPGGTGNFSSFNPNLLNYPPNPCVSNGNVAFWGGGSGGQQGLYALLNGTATRVADLNTLIPGGTGNFVSYPPSPNISGTNVTFIGNGSGQQGVYALVSSALTKIADLNTAIPSGTGDFTSFAPRPYISGSNVVFAGNGTGGQTGVYVCYPPNPCTPAADTNTVIPGTSPAQTFTGFTLSNAAAETGPAINGTNVAFWGLNASGDVGVFASFPPAPISPIADLINFPPAVYLPLFGPAISGTTAAFSGQFDPQGQLDGFKNPAPAVFVATPPAAPQTIAVVGDAVPGGFGGFINFGAVAIDPNHVVFEGFSNDASNNPVTGLYTNLGGSVSKIVSTGDTVGGKVISNLNFGPGGFSSNQVVFEAEFTDGSESIMAATFLGFVRCPESLGFWKNHTAQWPVSTLVLGNQNYSQSELLALLRTSSTSDASLVLARQLIAAKLNIANSSDPTPVNSTISDADGLLSTFSGKLPYNVKTGSTIGKQMVSDSDTLDNYNADQLTPGCIP